MVDVIHKVEIPGGIFLNIEGPADAPPETILKFARDVAYPQYLQETRKPVEEKTSFSQTLANIPRDVGLNVAQGAVSGFRMIADAFGADSDTSKNLRGVEGYLGDLMSAQAKNNKKEISRIMQEAEKQGVSDQVIAGLKSLTVAPLDTLSNAFGTMAPVIVGSLAAEIIGPAFAVASGLGVGGAMGAGTVKGAIYDNVKEAFLKANPNDPATAEARAIKAQEYGGENLDLILGGAALGGLEATTGVQPMVRAALTRKFGSELAKEALAKEALKDTGRSLPARVGIGALHEAFPEGLQGAQEQYAGNVATIREGFEGDPMAGVVAHGVLEGTAGGILGGSVAGATGKGRTPTQTRPDLTGLREDIDTSRKATSEDLENILSGRAKGSPPPLALPAPVSGIAGLLPAPSEANRPTGPGAPGMYALNEGNPITARDQTYRGNEMGPYAEGQAPSDFVSGFLPPQTRVPTTLALPSPSGAAPAGPSPAQYGATMQNMARQETANVPMVPPTQQGQSPQYGPPTLPQMVNMRLPNGGIMTLPAPTPMKGLPAPSGAQSAPTPAQYAATIQQQMQREGQSMPLSQLPKSTYTEEEAFGGTNRPSFDLGYRPSIDEMFPAPKPKEEGPSEAEKLFAAPKFKKGPPPTSLAQFVRAKGGLHENVKEAFSGRDITHGKWKLFSRKTVGDKRGFYLDEMTRAAIVAGYYPGFDAQINSGINKNWQPTEEMMQKFREDLERDTVTNNKVYRPEDIEHLQEDPALFDETNRIQREQFRDSAERKVIEDVFGFKPDEETTHKDVYNDLDAPQKKLVDRVVDKMEEVGSSSLDQEPSATRQTWDQTAPEVEYSKAGRKPKTKPVEETKTEPVITVTQEKRDAAKARIDARLQEVRAMGSQGVELATALEKALADRSIDAEKIVSAFEMSHTVGRLLGGLTNAQKVSFAQKLMAGAEEVGGIRHKSPLGGLIELSLNPDRAMGTSTAAHESFHILQDVFAQSDKAAGKIINDAFKGAKTIDDVSPNILRILKNTRSPLMEGQSLYDQFKQVAPDSIFESMDQAKRERELQAYTFGFLDNARMNGINVGTMGSAFTRFMNFLRSFRESMGNFLRGRGFNTVEDMFEGVTRGEQQQDLSLVADEKNAAVAEEYSVAHRKDTPFTPPKNTVTAYKLFATKKSRPGELFPLFINPKEAVPIGEWIPAKAVPTKGFAPRPGWHAGEIPSAPHLRSKITGQRAENRVWAEVQMPNDVNWQAEADSRKKGSNKGELRDQIPNGGYYKFNTKSEEAQGGVWYIGGALKVTRILNDKEVFDILAKAGDKQAASAEARGAEFSQAVLPPEYSKATGVAQSKVNSEKHFSIWDQVREFFDPFYTVDQFNVFSSFRNLLFGKVDISHSKAKRLSEIISKGTKVQQDEVYKYLTTKDANPNMVSDTKLREAAIEVKKSINETAKQMVKEGILSQESMDKYYDRYLPRMYVYYEMTNRGIKSPNMGISPQEYLKKRDDQLSVDERKMLGEITNPAYLAYVAIARPAKDIALSQFFTQIMKQSGTKWILPNSVVEVNGQKVTPYWLKSEAVMLENTVLPTMDKTDVALIAKMKNRIAEMKRIADKAINESNPVANTNMVPDGYRVLPDSARYGVLRGAVIQKGIYDDIVGSFVQLPNNDKPWLQALMGDERSTVVKLNQLWKMGKVTLNVPSQIRNAISNAIALNVFAGVPVTKMAPRILQALNERMSEGKFYKEAQEFGIAGGTMSGAELNTARAQLDSYLRQNNGGGNIFGMFAAARIIAKAFVNKTSDFYQGTEVVFKLAAYIHAREQGMSPSDSVNLANDALFDYTRVNPNIRYIRNSPIGLPFVTYLYKVIPKTIETAVKHPFRFAPYIALFYAIPALAMSALDIDEDDYEAMRKSLPEYLRNKGSLYIMPYRGEKGEIKYADLGYFFPWATFVDPLIQMGRGDIAGGANELKRNFMPSGPIVTAITALATNKDSFTGRDIVDPRQTPENKALALLSYVWNQALPPMIGMDFANPEKSGGVLPRLYSDAFGTGTGLKANGQPKPEFLENAGRLLGLNIDTTNPIMARAQNILHMQAQIHASEALRSQIAKDQSLTIERRRSEIAALNEKIRSDYKEIQKYAQETARASAGMKKGT